MKFVDPKVVHERLNRILDNDSYQTRIIRILVESQILDHIVSLISYKLGLVPRVIALLMI